MGKKAETEQQEANEITEIDVALGLDPADDDEGFEPVGIDDDPGVEAEIEARGEDPQHEPEELVAETEGGDDEPLAEPAAEPQAEDQEPETTEEPAKDPAAAALEGGEKRPSDEFGDLPKDAKEETRQRFETMKTRFDEVSKERDTAVEQNTAWMESVRATGTNPEQLGAMFDYLTYVNAGTTEGLEKAHEILTQEAATIGKMLGKPAPGYSPLDDHEDLKARVEDGYLTEDDAMEIAAARARTRAREAQDQQQSQQRQATDTHKKMMSEMSKLGAKLKASDPLFEQKMPIVQKYIGKLTERGVDESQWPSLVEVFYESIEIPDSLPPRPTPRPQSVPAGATGEGRGGVTKEPGSVLEAIDMALDLR